MPPPSGDDTTETGAAMDQEQEPVDRGDEGRVDCGDAVKVLYTFLDGELTTERRELIAHHLDACHHCLEAFEFEVELRHVIAKKCRDEVPEDLLDRVAKALESEAGAGT